MGVAKVFKCDECGEEFDYTSCGWVTMGKYKVFHYQCPECLNIDEEWVKSINGKAKRPAGVICGNCGRKTKAVSLKTVVCPNCGSRKFKEFSCIMLD